MTLTSLNIYMQKVSLPQSAFPASTSCVMTVKLARAAKKQKMKTDVNKKPVLSFTTPHTAYKTIKSLLHAHSICKHDEQKILDLE